MFLAAASLVHTSAIQFLDCTLRDGSYAVDFQFHEEFVVDLLRRLNESSVSLVEIGHGLGLEAERIGIRACNIHHVRWSELAAENLTAKPWGMFAQPEFTQLETVSELCARGMSFLRVGMEPDRVGDYLTYLRRAVDTCPQVYLNLMKSSATPVAELPALLSDVPDGLAGVYVVDSYGAMLPSDVQTYVSKLAEQFAVVGFHGHDNLGLANVNTITALQSGARVVDGTLNGIGRGSGNASIESMAGILKLLGLDIFNYEQLAKLAELCRVNMDVIGEDRTLQVLGGVIGIHSGFFPLVVELAAKHNTEPARLMEAAVSVAAQSPRKADFHTAATILAGQTAQLADSTL